MAYTSIHSIKTTLKKAIQYICNEEKTEHQLNISSYGCSPINASEDFEQVRKQYHSESKNLARHFIQSFHPEDDIDENAAHKIGEQFCEEYLKGEFQYVLATHNDKGHIHNHVIFNNINFKTGKVYNSHYRIKEIEEISNHICKDNGLHVIETEETLEQLIKHPKRNSKSYYEVMETKKGMSWKAIFQDNIDKNVLQSKNYEDFLTLMMRDGYIFDDSKKYLSFQALGQERMTRCREKTLGVDYTREKIKERISKKGTLDLNKEEKKKQPKTFSLRNKLKDNIDQAIQKSNTYDEFLSHADCKIKLDK